MKISDNTPEEVYEFGDWTVYPKFYFLKNLAGKELPLEPRLMNVFAVLLKNEGEVLERDVLIEQAWKETLVNEESLTKAIFDLRKFLHQHSLNGIEIQTLRKVGYRLEIIKEKQPQSLQRRILRIILRAALYVFLGLVLLILVVRAVNY